MRHVVQPSLSQASPWVVTLQEEDGMGVIEGALKFSEVEESTKHRDKLDCMFECIDADEAWVVVP